MARYNDADELKKCSYVIEYKDEWHMTKYGEFVELADIENAPTADVVEKERYVRCRENANILADALSEYQSADAVEVVRCKDCAYKQYYFTNDMVKCGCGNGAHHEDFFCADGERKDYE